MSPQTYRRRIKDLLKDMMELYQAATDNPVLGRSVLYLNRSVAVLDKKSISFQDEQGMFKINGSRQYVERCIEILKRSKHPMTLQQLLAALKDKYPEFWDVQYRQFHPIVRAEIRKQNRRLAEASSDNKVRFYVLSHWRIAVPYIPKLKYGAC